MADDTLTTEKLLAAIESLSKTSEITAEIRCSARSYEALRGHPDIMLKVDASGREALSGVEIVIDNDLTDEYCEAWTAEQVNERRKYGMTAKEYRIMLVAREAGWDEEFWHKYRKKGIGG